MLVHHDDAKREYAYGAESKIGTFSDALMAEAKKKGWIAISMKDDWNTISQTLQNNQFRKQMNQLKLRENETHPNCAQPCTGLLADRAR